MSSPPSPTIVLAPKSSTSSMVSPVTPIVSVPSARSSDMPPLVTLKPVTPPTTASTQVTTVRVSPVLTTTVPSSVKTIRSSSVIPKPSIQPATPASIVVQPPATPPSPTADVVRVSPATTTVVVPSQTAQPSPITFTPLVSQTPQVTLRTPSIVQPTTPLSVAPQVVATPSVVATPTPAFSADMARPKSVEDLLSEKGFTSTDKVFLDKSGQVFAKFIKVTTDLGQTAFVELDSEGMVQYQPSSRTMIEEDVGTMVPEQSKVIGTYECSMKGGGCGVAFDCNEEVCVMSRPADSTTVPTPVVLKKASKPASTELVVSGVPTAYPVVRLSDALKTPLATKASIEKSTKAIRNAGVKECKQYYDDLRSTLADMNAALNANYAAANSYIASLANDTKQLQQYRATYVARSPLPEAENKKAEKVVQLLHDRSEQIIELFKLCEALPSIENQLRDLINQVNDMTSTINANAGVLGKAN